jgi:8-oxo-dGTP pyrophosphatase MutT (NUDIX family)
MASKRKSKPRRDGDSRQFAALPLMRQDGETLVMLVTSRETRRWILPKGWAEPGLAPHQLAAKEAFEEAGLVGEVDPTPVGTYRYAKRLRSGREVTLEVGVFALWVERQLEDWPERKQRETKWFTLSQAALAAEEGELVTLLLRLAAPEP